MVRARVWCTRVPQLHAKCGWSTAGEPAWRRIGPGDKCMTAHGHGPLLTLNVCPFLVLVADLCRNCMPKRDDPKVTYCWAVNRPILYRVSSHGVVGMMRCWSRDGVQAVTVMAYRL